MAFSAPRKLLRVVVSCALLCGTLTLVSSHNGVGVQDVNPSSALICACNNETRGAARPLFNPHDELSSDLESSAAFDQNKSEISEEGWKTVHVYVGKTSSNDTTSNLWQSFSQSKQDSVVKAMLPRSGYFIDLAANDWQKDSNTYSLETFEKWNGLCIEPNEIYWSGLLRRKCTLVSAVVSGKHDELVQFASTKGGLGGIVATNMDNERETNNLKEFRTTTVDEIFTKYHVPYVIDYMSLDIEGAESVVFPLLPFQTYKIYILTIERPKDDVRSILRAQNYVEVGVLGDYGDTMFLNAATPNFKEVLRVGQFEITMQQRQENDNKISKAMSDVDLRPVRVNNAAMGVRCPYYLLEKCGRVLPAWDTPYEEIAATLKDK